MKLFKMIKSNRIITSINALTAYMHQTAHMKIVVLNLRTQKHLCFICLQVILIRFIDTSINHKINEGNVRFTYWHQFQTHFS
jgi:hypothetical protein